ncbi:MAG: putative DNA binding domain-containing protein [Planctomycetaceae bacterium]|jgi:ATP-dependent DNA helicase RecG|nr:putative DNA binding domain-containing protein [Planctomycetaceae bacterium]
MEITNKTLQKLLNEVEGEHCEFKAAETGFSFDKLVQYACAFANMGGGKIILGITDKRPRQVIGTQAFEHPESTCTRLMDKLQIKVDFQLLSEFEKRVIVFSIAPRPIGIPIKLDGRYWTRRGESLVEMSESELRAIFDEIGRDFSADKCSNAAWKDLNINAIEEFRSRWIRKSGNSAIRSIEPKQLLIDCEAITGNGSITNAALVLFGTREALGRLLSQCEVIYEYRSSEAAGPATFRREFREGFFAYYDQLWELINNRNDWQHFQSGLFIFDIPTFDERIIREGILNAISHRNYQYSSSIFIRQYPKRLEIESPGGLPHDVTRENILKIQSPRNRRITEIFAKCGLVERAGQGMNLMFEVSVKHAKKLPDLSQTNDHRVVVLLDGLVRDPKILLMLEKIADETLESFNTDDFLIIDYISREKKIPAALRKRIPRLIELGVVERTGRGQFILSERYYVSKGQRGIYTRKKGLGKNELETLLLKHIQQSGKDGSPFRDLCQVVPSLSENQVKARLKKMKESGHIISQGTTRAGRWFANDINSKITKKIKK